MVKHSGFCRLSSIQNEIQKHFEENSDKPFKRHGKMSYYFKGDYYVIHVEPDGRLMTYFLSQLNRLKKAMILMSANSTSSGSYTQRTR